MKFILDTNVYIEAATSDIGWRRFEQTIIPMLPFVYISSVVVFELRLAGKGPNEEELLNRHIQSLTHVGRLVTPLFNDWLESAPFLENKKLRSQLCDTLIAYSARQIGAVLYTFDIKDFYPLSKKMDLPIKRPW